MKSWNQIDKTWLSWNNFLTNNSSGLCITFIRSFDKDKDVKSIRGKNLFYFYSLSINWIHYFSYNIFVTANTQLLFISNYIVPIKLIAYSVITLYFVEKKSKNMRIEIFINSSIIFWHIKNKTHTYLGFIIYIYIYICIYVYIIHMNINFLIITLSQVWIILIKVTYYFFAKHVRYRFLKRCMHQIVHR